MLESVVLALALFADPQPLAQDELAERVEEHFAAWRRDDAPGFALALFREGELAYAGGFGLADLEQGTPIDADTRFYLGSVSKQFVCFAIALLEAEGALSLEDDVREHVPELPSWGEPLRLHHLVHHTSGLRDYLTLVRLRGGDIGAVHSDQELIELLARQSALNFPTGSRYSYTNSGYLLLAVIVERASGQSLRAFAAERMFAPLGMEATHFHDDYTHIVPRRAWGYGPGTGDEAWSQWLSTFDRVGSGGVYSSVRDMLGWERNWRSAEVGGAEVLARMLERGELADGTVLDYAMGVTHGQHRGQRTEEHGGALGGYRSAFVRLPESDCAAVVLGNIATLDSRGLAVAGLDLLLGEQPQVPAPRERTSPAPAESVEPLADLQRFAGDYSCDELAVRWRLEPEGDAVHLRVVPLGPDLGVVRSAGPLRLWGPIGALQFEEDTHGEITSFRLDAGRASGLVFSRM